MASTRDESQMPAVDFKYPNEIGPGVYDIHSPRVPPTDEMSNHSPMVGSQAFPDQHGRDRLKTSRYGPQLADMIRAMGLKPSP